MSGYDSDQIYAEFISAADKTLFTKGHKPIGYTCSPVIGMKGTAVV